jgi:hypothetical protein
MKHESEKQEIKNQVGKLETLWLHKKRMSGES